MSEDAARGRQLGRGLSALFGEEPPEPAAVATIDDRPRTVPVEHLRPGAYQPRRNFDDEAMQSLVDSVRDRGILQPLIVRPDPRAAGRFEIIAGERRWRAAQQAQLHDVPVIVQDLTDEAALEIALIENVQRQDLNPLEEAEGYRRLMDEFAHTQEELARVVGKSRSHVANTLRLLQLPDAVRAYLINGALSAGHARALLNAEDSVGLAKKVIARSPGRRPGCGPSRSRARTPGVRARPPAARSPARGSSCRRRPCP